MEIKVNQHGNYFLKIKRTTENRKKKKERERENKDQKFMVNKIALVI